MNDKALNRQATMLGAKREYWLASNIVRPTAPWNVLPLQVIDDPLNRGEEQDTRCSMDHWPRDEVSRCRLLKIFHKRKIADTVVLTRGIHVN